MHFELKCRVHNLFTVSRHHNHKSLTQTGLVLNLGWVMEIYHLKYFVVLLSLFRPILRYLHQIGHDHQLQDLYSLIIYDYLTSFNAVYLWSWKIFLKLTTNNKVGSEVLMAVSSKMDVFWVVAPWSLVEVYQRFRGPCCLHHQGDQKTSIY
jgi:hypothetical protein